MADPGFSWGGCQLSKTYYFAIFFAENCMKMKEFGPPACVPGTLPWMHKFFTKSPITIHSKRSVLYTYISIHQRHIHFLKKNLEDISPFCGATDTPVLDFWLCLLWVSKLEWAALFTHDGGTCVTSSLRFTSGVTPADLLAASNGSWANLFHIPVSRHWWGSKLRPIVPQINALPTELCRIG